ncbi:MAG: DNA internalization-related competence protein ComEC/Rec2 [Oscillospiraceae bacterium]|nr:DNA internalization-related competence protein ComEC/Rec2 [Oscillospiraceae bacterium]
MRRLANFSFSFAAAAAAYVWLLPPLWALITAGVLLVGMLVLLAFHTDPVRRVRIAALGAAVGLLWSWGYESLKLAPLRGLCGEGRTVTAQVCSVPVQTQYGGCSAVGTLNGGRIVLYLNCPAQELSLGDAVTVKADVIDVSHGSGDDNNLYYQSNDISLLALQRGALTVEKAEKTPLSCYPVLLAARLKDRIGLVFPGDTAGFAKAILTGDRSGLSFATRNAFSVTGISHIVAVSGMHVSLLIGILMTLCRQRRKLAAAVSIPVMLFFAAMLGFSASVTRAVIMNCVLLIAPLVHRENDAPTSLGLALLLLLAVNPWAIANVSLQLSFACMAGIFLLAPRIYNRLMKWINEDELRERHAIVYRVYHGAAVTVSTSVAATVFTAPLVASVFGAVSLISPLTNLLLMAVLSATFTLVFFAAIAALLYAPVGAAIAWVASWPIRYVLWLTGLLAKIPFAAVYTDSAYIVAWLLTAYLMLFVFFLYRQERYKVRLLLASLLVTLVGAVFFSMHSFSGITLQVFNVGQGQCIFLQNDENAVMIDCGGDEDEFNGEQAARSLLARGLTSVDALILTHFDTDHTCGALQFLSRVRVRQLIVPDLPDSSGNRETILRYAAQADIPVLLVRQDLMLNFGGGTLYLFAPEDPNVRNASLSALMSDEEYDILITGDMDETAERMLVATKDLPDLEVLIAGHHGAKRSTCEELLCKTVPDTVIISVGENTYGHPAQEVLDRIAAIGAAVFRTDLDGTITITR